MIELNQIHIVMTAATTLDSFIDQAMTLSPDNRLELAERLIASVPPDAEIEAAQIEEMKSRRQAVESGTMPLMAGDEVLRRVREAVLGRA